MKALVFVVAISLAACVFVADRRSGCAEGDFSCGNDDTVDVCVDGHWEIYDDCWDLCNGPGLCDYDSHGDPVCFCD